MPKYNIGASGQKLRVNFNQNISTATSYSLEIVPREGDKFEKTPTLGTSDTIVDDQTFLANKFVEYTILADDLVYVGQYEMKATAVLPSETVVTDYTRFRVMP